MKCEVCKKKTETSFMNKAIGTYIKDEKGKIHFLCSSCQKNLKNDKTQILEKLN